MHLNHLNVAVPDLSEAAEFFKQYLGFTVLETKPGIVLLRDSGDFLLAISNFRQTPEVPQYPREFHLGFRLGQRSDVDRMHQQLAAAGVDVGRPPAPMHGSYSFYFRAFDCLLIEFTVWESEPTRY